jgi:hypothetical protein
MGRVIKIPIKMAIPRTIGATILFFVSADISFLGTVILAVIMDKIIFNYLEQHGE